MHAHAGAWLVGARVQARRIRHRPALVVLRLRQQAGKDRIHPFDHGPAGPEVAAQPAHGERDGADAARLRLEEQRDVGLAEAVDGLHRVAHAEQRVPVVLLPARHQPRQQGLLHGRGVLILVHQHVTDAVLERQRQFARRLRTAERLARRGSHGRVVQLATLRERLLQRRGRGHQHAQQRLDAAPLRVGVGTGRQQPHAGERRHQRVVPGQAHQQVGHPRLEWLQRGREAVPGVDLPACRVLPRQQGRHQAFPLPERGRAGRRQHSRSAQRPQRAVRADRRGRLAKQRQQLAHERHVGLRPQPRQFRLDARRQQSFHVRARGRRRHEVEQLGQPQFTALQHAGQQALEAGRIVLQQPGQPQQRTARLAVGLDQGDETPHGFADHRRRVVEQLR